MSYKIVTMSVYASKEQQLKEDDKHRRSTYNLSVGSWSKNQGIWSGKTTTNDTSSFKKLDLTTGPNKWDSDFRFRLWLLSTDENIDEARSWARCTFRPAHDAGVVDWDHLYPMKTDGFREYLYGAHLNDSSKWEDMQGDRRWSPQGLGMLSTGAKDGQGRWLREENKPYTFSKCWRKTDDEWKLGWSGKYEIAVQVGLYYTGTTSGVFCEVDPEMDLGGGG